MRSDSCKKKKKKKKRARCYARMLKGIKAHTVYAYIHKQTQILNDANKLRSAVELNKQRDTVFTVILYLTVLCRLEWICILMYLPKEKCLKTNYSNLV